MGRLTWGWTEAFWEPFLISDHHHLHRSIAFSSCSPLTTASRLSFDRTLRPVTRLYLLKSSYTLSVAYTRVSGSCSQKRE
ncbi:hypothetical protein CC2G_007091 [Coprinopsis cinerea AmutBmut pab1-1]|nr:hypothetical protein CC2G_007091 [Coprinopsis cinerea AmutBmut pab1-1]